MTIGVGDVFYLRCTHCNPPKPKFFVVAQVDPMIRMFLINSEISDYEKSKPALVAAKANILAAEHAFLKHDSVISCDHISHEYSQTIRSVLAYEPRVFVGVLSAAARNAVAEALRQNELLPRKYLRDLRALWP